MLFIQRGFIGCGVYSLIGCLLNPRILSIRESFSVSARPNCARPVAGRRKHWRSKAAWPKLFERGKLNIAPLNICKLADTLELPPCDNLIMLNIIFKKDASKGFSKLPKPIQIQFLGAFEELAAGNDQRLDIKKLQGTAGYRLRIGQYRAIYEIDNGALVVYILKIGPRGDVYK